MKVKMNRSGMNARVRLLLVLMVMIFAFAEGFSIEEVHQQQDAYARSVQKEPNNGQGQGIGESVSEELGAKFLSWVASGNGHVPEGAVVGGRTSNGETLYIGRVYHKDDLIPGKIHPSNKRLYIAHEGKEHGFYNYEVLVEVPRQLPAI